MHNLLRSYLILPSLLTHPTGQVLKGGPKHPCVSNLLGASSPPSILAEVPAVLENFVAKVAGNRNGKLGRGQAQNAQMFLPRMF